MVDKPSDNDHMDKALPLVSVIVPVYKTRQYLSKCIKSILNQTYDFLQIILVEDGSPDDCGIICDNYAEKDLRIEVIHKENGGLASARNAGLRVARGEWIAWVDSDDWVEPDMIEYLLEGAKEYHTDIAVCGRKNIYPDSTILYGVDETTIFTSETALEMLLDINNKAVENFVWDKLWRRSLYEGIVYPEGKTFEDFAVTYRLFERANSIVFLPDAKYNYLQRRESIMRDYSLANRLHHYDAAKARYDGMISSWPQFKKPLVNRCLRMANRVWKSYSLASGQERRIAETKMKEISEFLSPFIREGYCPEDYGAADRAIVKLVRYPHAWSYSITNIINILFKLKKGYYHNDILFSLNRVKNAGKASIRVIRDFLKKGYIRRNARYIKNVRSLPLKDNLILYETFWGRGAMCSPYAIFRYLLSEPKYAGYEHVWVLDGPSDYPETLERYRNYPNVRFVHYMQRDYLKALSEAKYLFNNTAMPKLFIKRDGQICINTWHGIPLKKLGPDVDGGVCESGNAIRNFLFCDFLISANPFLTDIYKNTYSMQSLYDGLIIEEGYPRLDTLVRQRRNEYEQQLTTMGAKVDATRKIILYAPTWREKRNTNNDIDGVLSEYENVKKRIEEECPDYQVLVKVHQYVYQKLKGKEIPSYIIPATVDANEVLPVADILLVDYSSIFFDYLHFDRPILFYIPDIKEYADYRGLYFTIDMLPGPSSEKLEDVIEWVNNIDKIHDEYRKRLIEAREWCCGYPVGHISENVTDVIFNKNTSDHRLINVKDVKKKALFQTGRLDEDYVKEFVIGLKKILNLDEYDITVAIPYPRSEQSKEICNLIDKRIRVIVQDRTGDYTVMDEFRYQLACLEGIKRNRTARFENICREEMRRRYACCKFDLAVHVGTCTPIDLMVVAMLRGDDTGSRDFDAELFNQEALDTLFA